ncbi:MAG: flagellar hook protein FlgE [Lachnospiraceae bacterium]|nr:flagellar hook protein FlgE [Lachnospiraceae bacterium]MBR4144654.1 flagellar hook protein FlgE [Lachnospiraceae bacterium]MBR6475142.1 flagellar hook protein FlgE [Lachnospiraceae bacterium]
MMRSLYSGVSGLKVHQTKMDVIGNNISNVNTIGFKSSQVNFSDILYQTSSDATGPNAEARTAGINAKKIGLGASVSSISTVITSGGSQRTDNALDIMIEGNQFFIVDKGGQNYFTKAGDFTIDASGLLCNTSGCKVMGWLPDPNDPSKCVHDRVTDLRVKSEANMYVPPEATENVYFSGNIDYKDTQLSTDTGKTTTLSFYDKLGQNYMAVVNLKQPADGEAGTFKVAITDILDANRESIFVKKTVDENNNVTYGPSEITSFSFGGEEITVGDIDEETGKVTIDGEGIDLKFNAANGKFISVGSDDSAKSVALTINGGENSPFTDIDCDFSAMTMFASSGSSTFLAQRGSLEDGTGAGKPQGNMTGISVDASGRIYGSYDNGDKKLLCQIAVAQFSNPAGLEAVGSSLFAATMNSGAFNGIGEDISAVGGKMNTGVLEMSNVDLSTEFTSIITTQRGFQANSRIITTSDTLLEELINLKR